MKSAAVEVIRRGRVPVANDRFDDKQMKSVTMSRECIKSSGDFKLNTSYSVYIGYIIQKDNALLTHLRSGRAYSRLQRATEWSL